MASTQPMEVRFGDWFSEGFNLYKAHLGLFVVASLIALLLAGISCGILLGPMAAGLIMIFFRLREGAMPPPGAGDVFKGFSFFLPTFLFTLVWFIIFFVVAAVLSVVPILGQALSPLVGFVGGALIMFGLYLIVDRQMGFWEASMESINIVKQNFWWFLLLSIVANIVGGAGAILCGIGMIFTWPIQICVIGVAYQEVTGSSPAPAPMTMEE